MEKWRVVDDILCVMLIDEKKSLTRSMGTKPPKALWYCSESSR